MNLLDTLKRIFEVNSAALSAYARDDPPAFPAPRDHSEPDARLRANSEPLEPEEARAILGPGYSAIRTEREHRTFDDDCISTEGDAIDARKDFISYHSHRY